MRTSAAARRYARALFSIAREDSSVDAVRRDLAVVAELLEASPELRKALFRPLHPVAERRAVLKSLCERAGSSASVRNFLVFLIDQRRLVDFDGIRREYDLLADEAEGRVRAEIVAASQPGDVQVERLRAALAARTGRHVELSVRVDPELIGGAIAKVGDLVFDGSIRTQLSQLRDTLTRGQ
jgi:F-type H+-transporting ATPase subunit delta